jgi:hypothetical protein
MERERELILAIVAYDLASELVSELAWDNWD